MTSIVSLALVLQLHNLAAAPPSVIDAARLELTRAFAEIRVRVDWQPPAESSAQVSVVLLAAETGDLRRAVDPVMGAAMRTARGTSAVYVFYDRVHAEAQRYAVSTALVLAYTLAHELGHVLLQDRGHARSGIMRGCWTRDDFHRVDQGQMKFSVREAAVIRDRLAHADADPIVAIAR